ncbi:MAG: Maf family protein [Porphyromonas somerae]|uniref:Maf family protein n=1 Tax=Porphyromonas somerae TaxID=322095 RepID=UPI0026F01902|nr:Maf family protein [Porphyromonas somerae]MDD7558370.1 Maf family protein [Porphyromonas somerae]MDY5815402.1 Maf family protein [Porphyromonas somerae]
MMNDGKVPHPLEARLRGLHIILGSQSPRRVELLKQLGLTFEVRPSYAPEDHIEVQDPHEVPLVLATRKAEFLLPQLHPNDLLITADTVVVLEGQILEKPHSLEEAATYLNRLSGKWHQVITGYCLTMSERQFRASVTSDILFDHLTEEEISYYVTRYEVLDKAGAYGIQDWIGLIGVKEIQGSYHNVMGLPTAHLYQHLKKFLP